MNQNNSIGVIVPAAGTGTRFQNSVPKQYSMLGSQTMLEVTINFFISFSCIQKIYISVDSDDKWIDSQSFSNDPKIILTAGGRTRSQSVFNALSKVNSDEIDIIAVHDAARPWLSHEQFIYLLDELEADKNIEGIYPVISISESLREIRNNNFIPINRDKFVLVQTPQIFYTPSLKIALNKLMDSKKTLTDEAQAMEAAGFKVKAVKGDRSNTKITFPTDLDRTFRSDSRIGKGIDFHRFEPGKGILLGNVFIDCGLSIIAHSDGDILLHALADALLGAGGLNDIGFYFPDTDPENKDLSSIIIIEKTLELLGKQRLKPANIDFVIVCEQPKIGPYVVKIKSTLSKILKIKENAIAIKATTTEGMGIIGEGNGIAVHAIASLRTIG
jgi:2-C-methyl-D-erythritol 4-phosphate cytidylyltransferase / 2-C-methyl-D-erythritol 2,4-cyclodiphosphate synthase